MIGKQIAAAAGQIRRGAAQKVSARCFYPIHPIQILGRSLFLTYFSRDLELYIGYRMACSLARELGKALNQPPYVYSVFMRDLLHALKIALLA